MPKNVSKEELARLWATQGQEYAQSSSASFEGKKFFSYASTMGQIVENKSGKKAFLVNSSGYSVTASMWQNVMRSAIPKTARVFEVPGVDRWSSETFFDHRRILGEWKAAIDYRIKDAELAREPKKTRFLKEAKQIKAKMHSYAKFFGLSL